MLERIRELALEKLGSKEAADAFMEGFRKEASVAWTQVMGNPKTQGAIIEALAKTGIGLAGSLIGAGAVYGISKASRGVEQTAQRAKFEMALAQVMSTNKIVKGARPEKAKEYAETMFRFAPHVASDPNLLGSILSNAILGESIDPQTIKTLVDLEGRYVDNSRVNPLPGIRM